MTKRLARRKITEIADDVLADRCDPIEGCRAILALSHEADLDRDPAMRVLAGIDTQTDHVPKGNARTEFASAYLHKADEEQAEVLRSNKEVFDKALRQLRDVDQ